jgi:hypothetical protein
MEIFGKDGKEKDIISCRECDWRSPRSIGWGRICEKLSTWGQKPIKMVEINDNIHNNTINSECPFLLS